MCLQVSIECVERGELLANLRHKYSDLLNKVPQQIKRYATKRCCWITQDSYCAHSLYILTLIKWIILFLFILKCYLFIFFFQLCFATWSFSFPLVYMKRSWLRGPWTDDSRRSWWDSKAPLEYWPGKSVAIRSKEEGVLPL